MMNKHRFKHVDYTRYPRHRTLREFYMHNRLTIDAYIGVAFFVVALLGAGTALIGWAADIPVVKACGCIAAVISFGGWVACESGRG